MEDGCHFVTCDFAFWSWQKSYLEVSLPAAPRKPPRQLRLVSVLKDETNTCDGKRVESPGKDSGIGSKSCEGSVWLKKRLNLLPLES